MRTQRWGACTAGSSGADTIVLPGGGTYSYSAYEDSTFGPTALLVISSEITIEGSGATIERSGGPNFRLFAVDSSGNLTLDETTVSGGVTSSRGGGVYNFLGTVNITNSTISGNSAFRGGGVFNRNGGVGT